MAAGGLLELAMTSTNHIQQEFHELGRVWIRGALAPSEIRLFRSLSGTQGQPGGRFNNTDPLFKEISKGLFSNKIKEFRPDAVPVRIVSFDKTETVSWQLPWHQDRVIAVKDKHEVDGFSRWSRKAGIWHCEPPVDVLRRMLFVRVHLDENTHENGAMEIALGSHRHGKLSRTSIAECVAGSATEVTLAQPGDVLVMSMFMLHRSMSAVKPLMRRVLRVDYAADPLPPPLNWAG